MRNLSSFPKSRGFSLLEVLIALVILSVGLLALASLQLSLIRSSAETKAQSIAMAIAKERIEQLRAYPTIADYVALADQAALSLPDVGGNQGGIDFTRTTTVTRYVFDATDSRFEERSSDVETDAQLAAVTGNTYKPGKEFKRIAVNVGWTDSTGGPQAIALEDAVGSINPSDTIDLNKTPTFGAPRLAKVLRTNPGDIAGVIPIAVGNGSSTAATNPTPEVNANNQGSKVVETRFEVLTYAGLTTDAVVEAQSRVETAVVSCQCDYGTAPPSGDAVKGYRPTYWNGLRYSSPERADFLVPAGVENLPNNAIEQSEKCTICCRDHHDPANVAGPKFSPRRSAHGHNSLTGSTLVAADPAAGDNYLDVCRVIRVDGIFRVATDMYNDRETLVETANTGATPYPSGDPGEGESSYAGFVLAYLDARVVENTVPSTFNSKLRVRSAGTSAAEILVDTAIKVIENAKNLNRPALLEIEKSGDFKWLHSRGLYVDYLEEDARDKIVAAKAACKGTDGLAPDTILEREACVLPLMPFTSINTSEVALWSVSSEPELTVSNSDFKLVTDATGATDPIKGRVIPDLSAVSNDEGAHPSSSSTILDSNAGLAARDTAVHADEVAINDLQVFDVTEGPPIGNSSGTVYARIAAASGVLPSYSTTQAPQAFFKFRYSAPTLPASCDAVSPSSTAGYPNPYTCQDALVGGAGLGVIQSYNYSPVAKLPWTGQATCTKSNGGSAISIDMVRTDRPQCKNLDVTAQLERAGSVIENGTGKVELNDGRTTEITTIEFTDVLAGDTIIFNFTDESPNPYPAVTATDYTCIYQGSSTVGNGNGQQNQSTVEFTWKPQCPTN